MSYAYKFLCFRLRETKAALVRVEQMGTGLAFEVAAAGGRFYESFLCHCL
jgi:hypothetical protein